MFQNRSQVRNAVQTFFHGETILVVGDLMLDRYLWGEVSRISPEAPVPVVRLTGETESAGAAANVAHNLANLGIQARLVGLVGADEEGERLREMITQAGIDGSGIMEVDSRPTITKTRVIGGHQQMLRLDLEETTPVAESVRQALLAQIEMKMREVPIPSVVVLSDYGKGLLTSATCQALIDMGRSAGIPVIVDPKGVNYAKYAHATTLTPNRRELAEAVSWPIDDLNGLLQAGEQLREKLDLEFLTVTLSEQGIALLEKNATPRRIPAVAQEVFDVSGAGDTVVSTLAAGLAAGLTRMDALHLANLAAGVVVGKVGTTPINRLDLLAALSTAEHLGHLSKICNLDVALSRVAYWRERGDKLVFTNGCFDLLHAGHVTYLEKARNLGSRLVVAINTDRSVRALKGETRPIIYEKDRAKVLAAMASVDMVILFDEDTPLQLILALQPDVLAKGADYTEETVVGGQEVKTWGGQVALIPLVAGRSSSRIVQNIKAS